MNHPRNRLIQLLLIVGVIVLGLASRSSLVSTFPEFVTRYAGDTLWALMVYLGFGFLFPRMAPLQVALLALSFAFAIEVSQLYQVDWLNRIRGTRLGALVLGAGFLWSDFLCYTVGCALGFAAEKSRDFLCRGKGSSVVPDEE